MRSKPGRLVRIPRACASGSLALAVSALGAACRPVPPIPAVPAALDRFLDHPDRLSMETPGPADAGPAGPSPTAYRWDKTALRQWRQRPSPEGRVWCSPRLPFESLAEIDRIEVTLATAHPPGVATLLWNDRETLSPEEALRNRRELTLPLPRGTLVVRGEEIFDDSWHERAGALPAFRHLMIREPPKGALAIESVRIVPTTEALAARPSGRARLAIAGETRDVLFARTPGVIRYRARVPGGAALTFGVAGLGSEASIRYSVRLRVEGGSESVLFAGQCRSGASWHDVRLPLPDAAGAEVRLVLSAQSDRPGTIVLWSAPTIAPPREAHGPPNVILYVLDALRADRLGLYGYPGKTSPFLDRLGARGIVFRRCLAAATWTKPSVASLMTSLYPETHGIGGRTYSDALPEAVPTLADLLHGAGYVTAQFVANPLAGALSNLDQGFDYAVGPLGLQSAPPAPARPKIRSDALNARVIPWLMAHAHERFFVHIHSMDTHPPYAGQPSGEQARGGAAVGRSAAYDAEVRANDATLHHLYESLEARGLARTTLVVVTADHGESFGEHGVTGHGASVHEEEARVPLIMAADGLEPAVVDAPVHEVDVLPTILGRCGVPYDGRQFEGVDLLARPGPDARTRPLVVTRFAYPFDDLIEPSPEREWYAVVQGRFKLIVREPRDPREPPAQALYDLTADPRETVDVASRRPREVAELSGALRDFLVRQRVRRAEFLTRYPGPVTMGLSGPNPTVPAPLVDTLKSLGYIR